MNVITVEHHERVASVVLERGKVNALTPAVVDELSAAFADLKSDVRTGGIVLTGKGKFFSFGFDIPEFLSCSRAEFTSFLTAFTAFYRDLFTYPKPVVAALNGHAVAGGCMIALAADTAIVAQGNAKISLNEIGFGSSVFAGSTEMLQFRTGTQTSDILYSGAMYSAAEARAIGLVAEVVPAEALLDRAHEIAAAMASRRPETFASIKSLLRKPTADAMAAREAASIREFVEIWYSEPTWSNLRNITIRG